ncbi:MAG: hypothetical protein AB3K77_01740 [Methanosarcinaceae archaeon]
MYKDKLIQIYEKLEKKSFAATKAMPKYGKSYGKKTESECKRGAFWDTALSTKDRNFP